MAPRTLQSLLATGLLALAGCSTAAAPGAGQAQQVPLPGNTAAATQAQAQLRELIGDAACTDDTQCRTIGWGAKACGGPERWVAWSTARTDGAALEKLAQQHAEQQRQSQARSGIVSNCMYVADPGARCVANRCVLREQRAGQPVLPQ
ncbi:MAG: hypothetical protein AB1430_22915 [Pseudomonadota bacterium]